MIKNNIYEEEKQLARFAKAIAHPARIAILKLLAKKNSCYCGNIVEELPLAQSTVSQHLKELKEAGLIKGEILSPKIRYCINKENWEKARNMLQDLFDSETEQLC